MSNWWKRFFGLDNDDGQITENDHDVTFKTPNNINNSPRTAKGRFEDPGRHLEVKMVNQYPTTKKTRNNFEHTSVKTNRHTGQLHNNRSLDVFDEPAYLRKSKKPYEPMEYRHKEMKHDERKSRENHSSYQHEPAEYRGVVEKENKKKAPFRPTNVPSPIYGYQQRQNVHKPIVEPELVPPQEVEMSDYLVTTHEELPVIQHEKVSSEQDIDQWDDPVSEEMMDEEVTMEVTVVEDETQPLETSYIQEEQMETRTESSETTIENKNPAIPYNVLMFGADRQALRKRQQESPAPVSDSFPGNPVERPSEKPPVVVEKTRDVHVGESKPPIHQTIQMVESSSEQVALPLELFQDPPKDLTDNLVWINEKEEVLKQVLKNFHVHADIVSHVQGPTVTRFEIRLHPGVKVSKVIGLTEDIKLSMAAEQIRIAPVAGKSTVGIEIPNEKRKPVYLKTLLQSESFKNSTAPLTAALGIDISGKEVVTDLSKMPHGLIAGATGSGKSVCIHSLILSLIYKSDPDSLRLVLIDPKVVELAMYQRLPHLAAPVINQPKDAALALRWAVEEMERRYQAFADVGVRDIKKYNLTVPPEEKWPYIVIIIDELADLMMVSPQDVEESICRIAQKARAAGIHLLLATQRPSVDVITGLIKANIPTRIAFGVSAQADSRTILDSGGAERLLGQGDMLFAENGSRDIQRLQGAFVSDEEIDGVTEFLLSWPSLPYLFDPVELREQRQVMDDEDDELYQDAATFVIDQGQASVSSLQRRFRIGYNRAARLIDSLEANDVISEANGSKPRQVLMTKEMFVGND